MKMRLDLECLGTAFHKLASFKNVKQPQQNETPQGPELCAFGISALRMYVEGQIEPLQIRPHFRS